MFLIFVVPTPHREHSKLKQMELTHNNIKTYRSIFFKFNYIFHDDNKKITIFFFTIQSTSILSFILYYINLIKY